MYRETTFLTNEFGLSPAVGLGCMPAMATSPAGIPWVYEEDRNASELRLVGDKSSEFVEGPLAESFSLLFSNRYPEALEVFKDYASPGVFGGLNDSFGNGVVGGAFESSFPAGELPEMPFGGRSPLFLEGFLEGGHFGADVIHSLPGEVLPIGSCGEIDYPEINSERPLWFKRCSVRDFDAETKVKIALAIDKVGLSSDSTLVKLGVRAEDNRYLKPSVKTENRDGIEVFEGENPAVVYDGGVLPEDMKPLLLGSIGFRNLADGPDGKLCGKTVGRTDMGVNKVVESYLSEFLLLEGYPGDVVASFVEDLDGSHQRNLLFFGREEFDFDCKLHGYIVSNLRYKIKKKGGGRFLCQLKQTVSTPEFL
jgi:hypothetical protein